MLLFMKGPCAPVLVIPSITGSKLVAEINPKEMKESDREICDLKESS